MNGDTRRAVLGRAALALGFIAAGCGGAAPEGDASTVRDSAGIEIVENRRGAWNGGEHWSIDPIPVIEIAGSPNTPLFNVVGVIRTDDGRTVLANQSSSELLVFDATGNFVTALGKEGDGPGEFRDISDITYCGGDSITVYDRRTLRATVITLNGTFLHSFAPQSPVRYASWPRDVTCNADGTRLVVGWGRTASRDAGPGRQRPNVPILVLQADSTARAWTLEVPGTELQAWVDPDGNGWWGEAPFARHSSIVLGGSWIHVATGDSRQIEQYEPSGRLVRLVRWTGLSNPVTPADARDFEIALLDSIPENRRRLTESLFARVEYPETMPPYGVVIADDSGYVWVREYARQTVGDVNWMVFGPDGRELGTVAMPASFAVHEIGQDFALGVAKDESGVEHVLMYRLNRRP